MNNKEIIERSNFITSFNEMATKIHENAQNKGFWDKKRNDGECIALMHSELSEALEEMRKENGDGYKIGMELADCVIRIMDYAIAKEINLGGRIIEKHEINEQRPHKHGKKF